VNYRRSVYLTMTKPKSRAKRAVFSRRYYQNFKEIREDFRYLFSQRELIRKTMREIISFEFRERLMMVVTQVNGCRYCRSFHAKEALKSGITNEELKVLLAGEIPEDAPMEEMPALAYAQHWAESDSQPDKAAVRRLVDEYGQEKADAIEMVLRMIRMGNLSGNLLDYILFKLSFGKLGVTEKDKNFLILK